MPLSLKRRAPRRRAAVAAAAVLLAGCQDMAVTNPNNPDIATAFRDPVNVESAVATSFRAFWGVSMGARTNANYPVRGLAGLAEELTSADDGYPLELISEPRQAYNNRDAGQWYNRKTWYDLYEVIATNTDAILAMDRGLRIGPVTAQNPNGEFTARTRYIAKLMQGLSHALHRRPLRPRLRPRRDAGGQAPAAEGGEPVRLRAAARRARCSTPGMAQLQQAVTQMNAAPVQTMPPTFVNGMELTNRELAQVAQGYMARLMVAVARTPAERAAVDWRRVLQKLDSAAITRPFGQQANAQISGTTSAYLQHTQLQTNSRTHMRLLGPADTSGAYQAWVRAAPTSRQPFDVVTPDRRIHAAGGPRTRGTYFERLSVQTMPQGQGNYLLSNYRGVRYGTNFFQTGFIPTLTPAELGFLRAEAFIRLGRRQEAADIINRTRTANGQLRAVTATAPCPGPTACPRKDDGTCGSLMDALMYEKRIELHGQTDPMVGYTDYRGWGRLVKGSLLQMPVIGRELQTLGLDLYSFGGDLPGSAPGADRPGIQ
jgi:hypothetical protein